MSIFASKKNYKLQLPNNFVGVDEEEMEYVDGGSASIAVDESYLSKSTCSSLARGLVSSGRVTGMTQTEVAQEIFAHAMCYYGADSLKDAGISGSVVDYLYNHANPIDIADGGDTWYRKAVFAAIWNLNIQL
ncbi:hypothetical protein [Clostridium cellulovorans]|uniref:Uncharacterized protein n=1 Tax=Clostridium cellulovorans (strain ATCC 35296 / DSM 3052 / OCM 3 / 743B) TaxID=573061 RepID=D9SW38_CLOC7|nr:hypothetical protein [Clostridium cellulovorans]ADL51182.1 hypothetical protein Clocel_1429 [Clostridium cellulovorans 743B]